MVSKLFIMIVFFLISGKGELRARKLGKMPMAGIVSPFLLVTSLLSSCFSSPSLPRCVLKGTMSPQVHAQVDNNNFEIVSPTFSNTVREFRRLLCRIGCKCKGISTDFEKLYIFYRK